MQSRVCGDYLYIPNGAIPNGEEYKITEYVITEELKKPSSLANYIPVVSKKYKEVRNRPFLKHVEIVTVYCSNEPIAPDLKITHMSEKKEYTFVPEKKEIDKETCTELPDMYYTVFENTVKIYTKHFCVLSLWMRKNLTYSQVQLSGQSSSLSFEINTYIKAYDNNSLNVAVYAFESKNCEKHFIRAIIEYNEYTKKRIRVSSCIVEHSFLKNNMFALKFICWIVSATNLCSNKPAVCKKIF